MQVDVMGDLNTHSEVHDSACIVCLKCSDACPTGSIALSLRRYDASLPADATARADRSTLKRRKISAFDVTIAVIWVGVSLYFFFSGVRTTAPQELKVIMSVGLLVIVYGLVWAIWKIRNKIRERTESDA
jgi:polyferredoxin